MHLNAPWFPNFEAVLWDMDGTILDTEPYWIVAEEELTAEFGLDWSHEQGLALAGWGLTHTAQVLHDHGVELPINVIIDRLTDRVIEQIDIAIPWRPGAAELLTDLREHNVRLAMVTMSISRMAHRVAQAVPGKPFEIVVSGDMVQDEKPHPEAYQLALELLGVQASAAIAIEDSPSGVRSAHAAGVFTVGVTHLIDLSTEPADLILPTLAGVHGGNLTEAFAQREVNGKP